MVFKRRDTKNECCFVKYKNENIENVTEYKFLGILIKCNGNLSYSTDDLAKKAWKVLFSIKSYMGSLNNIPVQVACNLFDNMVKPILTYNSEITFMDTYLSLYRAKNRANKSRKDIDSLQIIDKNPMEKLHLKFCKFILGMKRNSSNIAVREEIDREPLELSVKFQTLKYLMRLQTYELNPLLQESFILNKELDISGIYSWFTYAKSVAEESNIDISELKLDQVSHKKLKSVEKLIKLKLNQVYKKLADDKFEKIDQTSKLYIYKNIKNENCKKFYLLNCKSFKNRQQITKLRISDHNLLIEKGRQLKIQRENRLCPTCGLLEDEIHFFLKCDKNKNIRSIFMNSLTNICTENNINIDNLTDLEKLKLILTPSTSKQVEKLSSFIKQSLELRTGDSQLYNTF